MSEFNVIGSLSVDIDLSYDRTACSYIVESGVSGAGNFTYNGNVPATPVLSGDTDYSDLQVKDWEYDLCNQNDVEQYCRDRLSEIRKINELSHTPSAFGCIASYVAALASYVYGRKKSDKDTFKKFCDNYLGEIKCELQVCSSSEVIDCPSKEGWRTRWYAFCRWSRILSVLSGPKPHEVDTSFSGVLYESVRCGIVHSLSVKSHDIGRAKKVRVCLTHDDLVNAKLEQIKDCDLYAMVSDKKQYLKLKINAFDFCTAVESAIGKIFDGTGSVSVTKVMERFKAMSPISVVSK